MSGLLSSASPWASDTENKGLSSNSNSNSSTKKRTPSLSINHNKTIKKMPESYSTMDSNMEEIQEKNQFRNSRVQEIIHNMSNLASEDAGQGLASFAPLPLFSEPKPEPPTNPSNSNSNSPIAYYSLEPGSGSGSKESNRNNSNLGNSYYHAYSEKSKIGNIPSYSIDRMRGASTNANANATFIDQDKILEKLNKMIYILEEQQNEPTKHITEEFILYTFLGVFFIFIVDSFSRTGKYIR